MNRGFALCLFLVLLLGSWCPAPQDPVNKARRVPEYYDVLQSYVGRRVDLIYNSGLIILEDRTDKKGKRENRSPWTVSAVGRDFIQLVKKNTGEERFYHLQRIQYHHWAR